VTTTFSVSYSKVLPDKLVVAQLVKKFRAIYGTPWFITGSQGPAIGPYPKPG